MPADFKVLVVEDETITAISIRKELERMGIEVIGPVNRGEFAVELAVRENPSVIVMDVRLAGKIDGLQAAQAIQNRFPETKIIIMTGYGEELLKDGLRSLRVTAFLEKPVVPKNLMKIIEDIRNG
jgi:two-component system, response regulator PdtaR